MRKTYTFISSVQIIIVSQLSQAMLHTVYYSHANGWREVAWSYTCTLSVVVPDFDYDRFGRMGSFGRRRPFGFYMDPIIEWSCKDMMNPSGASMRYQTFGISVREAGVYFFNVEVTLAKSPSPTSRVAN